LIESELLHGSHHVISIAPSVIGKLEMHLEKIIAEASAPKRRSRAALMATTVGTALVLGPLGYYEVAHSQPTPNETQLSVGSPGSIG
jgi:hypothetical protein